MGRINILFSTTRQWNVGDEFILFGIRRLLDRLGLEYNPIIYNRHPSITPQRYYRQFPWLKLVPVPHLDNSFALDQDGAVDYVIFAGTPEWFGGSRIKPLLQYILRNKIRCAFIGVGVHRHHTFNEDLIQVVTKFCDLIIARDPLCYELIKNFPNAYYAPCPSLFAAPYSRIRKNLGQLGIVIQADKTRHHAISPEVLNYILTQCQRLEREFPVLYIAHYIDDYKMARALGKEVLYSGYAEDYFQIYDRFDLVISTRVHGCGMASSLGIPNALIPHDGRFQTALKLKSHILQIGVDLTDWVRSVDISAESAALVEYRKVQEEEFCQLLSKHLSILR